MTGELGKAGKAGFFEYRTEGEQRAKYAMIGAWSESDASELSRDDLEKLRQKLATMSITGLWGFRRT
jgi:hypothetical protein